MFPQGDDGQSPPKGDWEGKGLMQPASWSIFENMDDKKTVARYF